MPPVGTESVCKERWQSIRVGKGTYLAGWTKGPLPTALPNTQSVLYPLENPTSLPGYHLFFLPLFFILSFFFFKLNQAQALNPGAENGTELQSPASTS